MDTADPPGAHEPDPGVATDGERSAHGRRPGRPARDARSKVARADLARVGREALELLAAQPDADLPVEDADRRRDRPGGTHDALALASDRDSFTRRESMRDDRRLERDDRARVANFVGDADHGIVP